MAVLEDLLRLLEREPTLTPKRVCELIAHRWGGERIYIAKSAPSEVKPTDTVQTLVARGVPKRTAYNWVTKCRRR